MRYLIALLFLTIALPAQSQTPDAPTSYELKVFAPGASAPQFTTPIPLTSVACNKTPAAPTSTTNPKRVFWADPVNAGKDCEYMLDSGGPIVALPSGGYEGTVNGVNAGGAGPESNRAPFSLARPPAAPTGVRFSQ